MIIRILAVAFLVIFGNSSFAQEKKTTEAPKVKPGIKAVVYKSPTCGCCKAWEKYLSDNGFKVDSRPTEDMNKIKADYKVPRELSSCHTAVIEGYTVEGHVPVAAIAKLLKEKPKVIGIAVPGMPVGSPGMEGFPVEKYDVIAFDAKGGRSVLLSQ